MHKSKGNYDVILGGFVDFGDALGKFENKAKPFLDRIKEIKQITRSGSKEYDKLPQPDETPLLAPPSPEGDGDT